MSNTVNVLSSPIVRASLILKNTTAENWTAVNPILLKGELGIEIDTNLLKVGDGIHHYNELDYINVPRASLEVLIADAIPVANEENKGGVISSNDNNSISVDEEGKMTVNNISVSNLYVDDEDEFIISGGNAGS